MIVFYFLCTLLSAAAATAGAANIGGRINWTALALALFVIPYAVAYAIEL